jgi:hypothetical protein
MLSVLDQRLRRQGLAMWTAPGWREHRVAISNRRLIAFDGGSTAPLQASTFRGFLPWRRSDDGPVAVAVGPSSETL